jgi:hypothetical protein
MADDELKIVTTASNEPEAEMIRIRLLEAGIHAVSRRTIGGPEWGTSGARYMLVNERDLGRARELLESDEGISEQELSRQSEEAGREPRDPEPSG